MHLVSFPTEAQSLSSLKSMDSPKREGFALKSSILLKPTLWHHLRKIE